MNVFPHPVVLCRIFDTLRGGSVLRNVLCLICLFPLTLSAADYFVSPSGNDAATGLSAAEAWQTLQHAADMVAAGDSVTVLPGVYSGFYLSTGGSASQRIVFYAEPGVLINQPNGITDDGINLEGASYVTVEGFTVYGVPRTGIRTVTNTDVIIRNNTCDSCGFWGILTGFSDNILIEGNICSRAVEQHGIYFGNSADNPVIRGNVCRGNHDAGIHINADASLGGDGIISNGLVEDNILYGNGAGGGAGINCDGVQHTIIRNNLIYDNHASGIALFRIDGAEGSSDNVVVNNTVLQDDDGRWALEINNGSTGNIIFNNIFYSAHVFRGSISIDNSSMDGFHSNNNVQTDRMSTDDGSTVISLSEWQNSTGQDSNSVIATPDVLFVDAAGNDYHLKTGSPAIDLGVLTYYGNTAPGQDLEGNTRPSGPAPDAGAYELPAGNPVEELQAAPFDPVLNGRNIYLYDLQGRCVLFALDGTALNTCKRDLPSGVYFFLAQDVAGIMHTGRFAVLY